MTRPNRKDAQTEPAGGPLPPLPKPKPGKDSKYASEYDNGVDKHADSYPRNQER